MIPEHAGSQPRNIENTSQELTLRLDYQLTFHQNLNCHKEKLCQPVQLNSNPS